MKTLLEYFFKFVFVIIKFLVFYEILEKVALDKNIHEYRMMHNF